MSKNELRSSGELRRSGFANGAAERPYINPIRKEASVSVKTKKQTLFGWLLMIVAVIALLCGLIRLCNYLLMDDSQSYTYFCISLPMRSVPRN